MRRPSQLSLILAAAFVRGACTSFVSIVLGLHLAAAGLSPAAIGWVVSAGLWGNATGVLALTLGGHRFAPRGTLVGLALLGAVGIAAVALAPDLPASALAAFAGMVNGVGRDRGASLALDQAVLPGATGARDRTRGFALYGLVHDGGHGAGALLAGLPAILGETGLGPLEALRVALLLGAALLGSTALLYAGLPALPPMHATSRMRLAPRSRSILTKISLLFALDGLGTGFIPATLVTYFLGDRFGVGAAELGPLFFAARLANAASYPAAARLAGRFGLVNTMVFTHIPSSLLLAAIPWAPTFPAAAALFLAREAFVEMDVPTRQSYVMAIVQPEERVFAAGVTQLARLGAWAMAPAAAGVLMQTLAAGSPLVVGAGLKVAYDLLLYTALRRHRAPEEGL